MEFLKWQKQIMEEKDLDIFEIISVRNSGKSILGLAWVLEDADISIILSKLPNRYRKTISELKKELGFGERKVHVIGNIDQMRHINTHPKKRVKIVVDEYFRLPDISLKELDKVMGHDKYKVMFIGTRINDEDKFKIPYSKHYSVDLVHLLTERIMTTEQLQAIINHLDSDQLHIEFGTPLESN